MLVFEFPLHKTSIRGTLAILAIRDLFKLYRGRGTRQVNRPAGATLVRPTECDEAVGTAAPVGQRNLRTRNSKDPAALAPLL